MFVSRLRDYYQRTVDSLWFVPGLIVLGAIVLAAVLVEMQTAIDAKALEQFPRLFGAGAEGARGLLGAIATSMITVAGVTFSITIVAVAQASTQYTPRILRNFMRDRTNQFVLGVFVGIFAYCLVVLRTIRGSEDLNFIPSVAILVAIALALLGIGVLIYFIHHIAETLQASSILSRVARETVEVVDRLFPDPLGEESPESRADRWRAALRDVTWSPILSRETGYLQSVQPEDLLRLAGEHGVVIRMEQEIGDFVVRDTPLASVAALGNRSSPETSEELSEAITSTFVVNSYRTIHQDAAFGLRQLVDVALKGLSPSVNDPTTAKSCIDYISAILTRLARRRLEERYREADGELRVIARGPTFESLLGKSISEIRQAASRHPAVLMRLIEALAVVDAEVRHAGRREAIRREVRLIRDAAERDIDVAEDREPILRAADLLLKGEGHGAAPARTTESFGASRTDSRKGPVPGSGQPVDRDPDLALHELPGRGGAR